MSDHWTSTQLHWRGLDSLLETYLSRGASTAYIVAPFISYAALERLLSHVSTEDGIVVTSWRGDHLVAGASDLRTFELATSHGWTYRINDNLHIKLYSRDARSAVVGSANLTQRALCDAPNANHELLVEVELHDADRQRLLDLVDSSVLVTSVLHQDYVTWLSMVDMDVGPRLPPTPTSRGLRLDDVPLCTSPGQFLALLESGAPKAAREAGDLCHDTFLFPDLVPPNDVEGQPALRQRLFALPVIARLVAELPAEGMHFGVIKKWLRDHCVDADDYSRTELAGAVQRIIVWVVDLAPDDFQVTVPGRHSQLLRRRAKD